MTTARRLGVATIALISLGASAAYYATMMAMQGFTVPRSGMSYLVAALVAAMTLLLLLVFWRTIHRSIRMVSAQLEKMSKTGQIGLVMSPGAEELAQVTKPLNELLTTVQLAEHGRHQVA